MIIENLINVLIMSVQAVLSLIPSLPSLPFDLVEGSYAFIDLIFDNIGLLGLFIPITTIKIVIPLVILIINFDKIYRLVIWVLKKIPIFGIEG